MNDMYTKEYQDLVYDLEQARTHILQWKAHILRSVNQDKAKQDIISNLNDSSALVVMDWAMKFLQGEAVRLVCQKRYQLACLDGASSNVEIQTYAYLFDYCQQDWFAV